MTTQIAVRLPDEFVEYLDKAVADGSTPSRAALITKALERELATAISAAYDLES